MRRERWGARFTPHGAILATVRDDELMTTAVGHAAMTDRVVIPATRFGALAQFADKKPAWWRLPAGSALAAFRLQAARLIR